MKPFLFILNMLFIFPSLRRGRENKNLYNTKHFSFNLRFQKLFSLFLLICKTNTTCLSKTGISQLDPAVSYLSLGTARPVYQRAGATNTVTCWSEQPFDSIWREPHIMKTRGHLRRATKPVRQSDTIV